MYVKDEALIQFTLILFSAVAYIWKVKNFFAVLIKSNKNQNLFAQTYYVYTEEVVKTVYEQG